MDVFGGNGPTAFVRNAISVSPLISTGLPSKRVGGSWVDGESGLNMMARATSLGRVGSSAAAMIAPLEKPMAVGALAKL
jgi:hypothetical protein